VLIASFRTRADCPEDHGPYKKSSTKWQGRASAEILACGRASFWSTSEQRIGQLDQKELLEVDCQSQNDRY
jgi:hypothetical protein